LPWFGKGKPTSQNKQVIDEKKKKTTDIRDICRFRFGEKSSNFHPRNKESQGDGGPVVNKVLFSSNSVSSDEQQKVGIELDFTTTNYDSDWGGVCINSSASSDLQSDTDSIDSEGFLDSEPLAEDDRRALAPPPSWVVDVEEEEKKECHYCNKMLGANQFSGKQWKKGEYLSTVRKCLNCSLNYYCRHMGGEEEAREFIDNAKRDNAKKEQRRLEYKRNYCCPYAQLYKQLAQLKLAALADMATKFDGQSHAFDLPIINTTTQEGLSHLESLILAKIRRGVWYYTGDSRMGSNGEILYNEGVGFITRDNTMICKRVRGGFVRLLLGDIGSTSDCLLQAIVHPLCAGELIFMYLICHIMPYHYFSSNIIYHD